MTIGDGDVRRYFDDGFLIVEDLLTRAELQPVVEAIEGIVEETAERLYAAGRIADKHADIDTLFKETKIDGASIEDGQWDFTKAKSFGLEGKSTADVHAWAMKSKAELAEITDELT